MSTQRELVEQILDALIVKTQKGNLDWREYGGQKFEATFNKQVVTLQAPIPETRSAPTFEIRNARGELVHRISSSASASLVDTYNSLMAVKKSINISTDPRLVEKVSKLYKILLTLEEIKINSELKELLNTLTQAPPED